MEGMRQLDELRNIDQVDAALCAYTAQTWLRGGAVSVGDMEDGQITLPVTALLDHYLKADVSCSAST